MGTPTIPIATTNATTPLAAMIPATVVVAPTTPASPGLKPSSAVLPTMDFWLGGVDYFEEGVWQWSNGDLWSFTNWHEGEPNNVDNEDCLSMSSQDSYAWMDLGCGTRDHGGVSHYAVCENRKG